MTQQSHPRQPGRQFAMQIDLPAAPDVVWRALAEAREIERWFATDVVCEPRVGGAMVWRWGDQHTWTQVIEVCTPGQHLRTRYDSTVADGRGGFRPLFIDFHLEGNGGTTTLRLVHSGFGPEAGFDAEYHGISGGWPTELRSLRLYLQRHRGRDRHVAWAAAKTPMPCEAAWELLTGPDGIGAAALPRLEEGQPFTMAVPGVPAITGIAMHSPGPREFTGMATNCGDAWLRVTCENWGGTTNVWLWLAGYGDGVPTALLQAYRRAFATVLQNLFGQAAIAVGGGA
ncbi:MAG: SRPBCC domain-containing protein [Planctomycetes bacterium]|nr:SRPBCC domain-containing protein [Planctomycetota bacterium]